MAALLRKGARGPGGPVGWFPLILGKKEEMTEGRKASRATKSKTGPHLSLAQDMDLSLVYHVYPEYIF